MSKLYHRIFSDFFGYYDTIFLFVFQIFVQRTSNSFQTKAPPLAKARGCGHRRRWTRLFCGAREEFLFGVCIPQKHHSSITVAVKKGRLHGVGLLYMAYTYIIRYTHLMGLMIPKSYHLVFRYMIKTMGKQ